MRPSAAELRRTQGQEAGEIAVRWETGRESVEAARAEIRDARHMIERGEADLRGAERDLERAEARRETCLRRMRAAQAEYGEAFPDRPVSNPG